jgi:hypothetical protein
VTRLATHAVTSLALAAPALAAAQGDPAPPSPITIEAKVPEGCPSALELRSLVRNLLGPAMDAGDPLRATVAIERLSDATFELTLETETTAGREVRRLRSPSCRTLGETAALLVAIVHDPSVDVSKAIVTPTPPPGISRPELLPEPPEPPVEPPVTLRQPDGGPTGELPPTLPPLPEKSADGLGFVANVFVGVAGLDLPKVHNPFGAAVGLRIGAYRVEGGVEASFGSAATLAGTEETKGADFSLVVGTLVACRAVLPWRLDWPVPALEPTLHACVGLEAGAMTGEGFGIADPEAGTAPWVAPRLEARGGLGIAGPLSFWLKAGAAFPVDPRRFVFTSGTGADSVTLVHEAGPVALRALLGAELEI